MVVIVALYRFLQAQALLENIIFAPFQRDRTETDSYRQLKTQFSNCKLTQQVIQIISLKLLLLIERKHCERLKKMSKDKIRLLLLFEMNLSTLNTFRKIYHYFT